MRIFITFVLSLLSNLIFSQDYYSRIIPTDFGNVNASSIYLFEDKYLITGIYFNDQDNVASTIITLNDDDIIKTTIFNDFAFTGKSIAINSSDINFIAKDRNIQLSTFVGTMDDDYTIFHTDTINTGGTSNFPATITNIENQIFSGISFEEGGVRKLAINKYDSGQQIIWNKNYENNIGYSALFDIIVTNDKNLLVSYALRYTNEFSSNAYLMKIDTTGEVIWKTEPMELLDGGAAPINMTELSDGNIILTYRKNMWDDYDFWCCLVPFTPTFVLLDSQGNILEENVLRIDKSENISISNLLSGNGSYYFSFGERVYDTGLPGVRNKYGLITKHTNGGDTIWTKRYRHPEFDITNVSHVVKDIIELDNGDIVALGSITPTGEQTDVWMFKVDENGCFDIEDCEDEVQIITSIDNISESYPDITIYPNPSSGEISIDGINSTAISRIIVFNVFGETVLDIDDFDGNTIDLSGLSTSYYLIDIFHKKGHHIIKPLIIN